MGVDVGETHMLRWGVIALVGIALLGTAEASPTTNWAAKLHDRAAWGDGEAVLRMVKEPIFDKVMKDPESLITVCTTFSNCWRILAARGGDQIDEIYEIVYPYAQARLGIRPLELGNAFCWACVVGAIERTRVYQGEKPDLERWQDAVRMGLTVANEAVDRRDLMIPVLRWCGELAAFKRADAEYFLAQADALQARLVEEGGTDLALIIAIAALHENKARAACIRGRKRDGLAHIEAGLAFVDEQLEQAGEGGDPNGFLSRSRCNLITTARELKLRCKACYRTRTVPTKERLLTVEIPESGSWKSQVPEGDLDMLQIVQFGPEGKSQRTIVFRSFRPDTVYNLDKGASSVLGTYPKKLAESTLRGVRWGMDTVEKESKIRKGRCRKAWPTGYHFSVSGTYPDGTWRRITVVTVREKKLDRTLQFVVHEFEDNEHGRCELEFVLASVKPEK